MNTAEILSRMMNAMFFLEKAVKNIEVVTAELVRKESDTEQKADCEVAFKDDKEHRVKPRTNLDGEENVSADIDPVIKEEVDILNSQVRAISNNDRVTRSPNDMQVGGSHYRGGDKSYQHWDLITEIYGNSYLIGNATKYVARHRSKNGEQDLRKALHYLDKITEVSGINPRITLPTNQTMVCAAKYFANTGNVGDYEKGIILDILNKNISAARAKVQHLLRVDYCS